IMGSYLLLLSTCLLVLQLARATGNDSSDQDPGIRFVFPFYPKELDILIGHLQTKVRGRKTATREAVSSEEGVGISKETDSTDAIDGSQESVESVENNVVQRKRVGSIREVDASSKQSIEESDDVSRESNESDEIEKKLKRQIVYLQTELFRVTQSLDSCEQINAGNHEAGNYVIDINDKGDVTELPSSRAKKLETITKLRKEIKEVEAKLDICRFKFWTGDSS
ncbi:hypothetical protein BgiMline_027659, partial [Biomphalaria glabrata]